MLPLVTPLVDQFDQLIEQLSSDEVSDWDLENTVNYCVYQLTEEKKEKFDLEELVEEYEFFYGHSIVKAIDNWHFNDNQSWRDFDHVKYLAIIGSGNDLTERIEPEKLGDTDTALSWGIYLSSHEQDNPTCVLNVANEDEARLISKSIHQHYFNHSITDKQLEQMADILSNDKNSSDDELRQLMVDLEILEPFIEQAITLRSTFLCDPFITGLQLNETHQLVTVKTVKQ